MDKIVMEDKLKEKVELSILFDFYGELLKNHNKLIFEDYILNDLSLGEIAEEQGISRQGVHDIIKRCSKQLREYEEKLSLIKKFEIANIKVNRIIEVMKQMKDASHTKNSCYTKDSCHTKDSCNTKNSCHTKESQELMRLEEMIELTENILQDL